MYTFGKDWATCLSIYASKAYITTRCDKKYNRWPNLLAQALQIMFILPPANNYPKRAPWCAVAPDRFHYSNAILLFMPLDGRLLHLHAIWLWCGQMFVTCVIWVGGFRRNSGQLPVDTPYVIVCHNIYPSGPQSVLRYGHRYIMKYVDVDGTR